MLDMERLKSNAELSRAEEHTWAEAGSKRALLKSQQMTEAVPTCWGPLRHLSMVLSEASSE